MGKLFLKDHAAYFGLCKFLNNLSVLCFGTNLLGHPLHFRENSDRAVDTETVHEIKTIHLPANTGDHYNSGGKKTDFALVELLRSVNICSPEETKNGLCWRVTPVRLPDTFIDIKQIQAVRTMGNN